MSSDRDAEQWVDHFLASDRVDRLRTARNAIEHSRTALNCLQFNHDDEIERAHNMRRDAGRICQEVYGDAGQMSQAGEAATRALVRRLQRVFGFGVW